MTLLLTLLAFGLMIFIHELGHFLVARAFGVGIDKFSIGFGKPIVQWSHQGVQWRIGWIPLGGYVKMRGENPDGKAVDERLSFQKKAWWKRALIAFSGPFANLLFGLLLFVVSFLLPLHMEDQLPVIARAEGAWSSVFAPGDSLQSVNGVQIRGFSEYLEQLFTGGDKTIGFSRAGEARNVKVSASDLDSLMQSLYPRVDASVGEVIHKTPAYHAKLQPGDLITAVDSVPVGDWYAMRELITGSENDSVRLDLRRGGASLSKTLRLESSVATDAAKTIGIMQSQPVRYTRHFKPGEALRLGAYNCVNFVVMNYRMLWQLVQKPADLQKSVGGPVMIVSMSQQMGQKGFSYLLLFFAGISLMLMIMNLLPIPILDGGVILFSVIEGLIRRPVPQRVQSFLQMIGFFILVTLMVFAFYSDISSEILRYLSR